MRAKILFAEGAFKKQLFKPKFERRGQVDVSGASVLAYSGPATNQSDQVETIINYGVDITTIVSMIEEGKI